MRYITSAVLRVRAQLDALLFVWSLFLLSYGIHRTWLGINTAPHKKLDSVQPT